MLEIPIEKILSFSFKEIMEGFKGKALVHLSDGTQVRMTSTEIVINRVIWELNKQFLDGFVGRGMDIRSHYEYGKLNTGTINKTINTIVKDIQITLIDNSMIDKNSMLEVADVVIEIIDILHNELSYSMTEHVVVIDYSDFMKAQTDTNLLTALKAFKRQPTERRLSLVYKTIDNYMLKNIDEGFASMYFSGAFKPAQVKTLLGAKGGAREIDGSPFRDIVTSGYLVGLNKASWYLQESRSIAKAAIQSKDAIQDSDTMARLIQIIANVLSSIDYEDCGTTEYRTVKITSTNYKAYEFKFYLRDDGALGVIPENPKDFIGKTIKVRSIEHCKCKNEHHVCATCFGGLAFNITPNANVAHQAVSVIGKIIIQKHLSTKHHISSSFAEILEILNKALSRYFEIYDAEKHVLKLKEIKTEGGKHAYLSIPMESLNVITRDEDTMANLDPSNVSKISLLGLIIEEPGNTKRNARTVDIIEVEQEGKPGYFTGEFLKYIAKNTQVVRKEFRVDLTNWDYDRPFISIVNKDYDFSILVKRLRKLILDKRSPENKNIFTNMDDFINTVIDTISSRMSMSASWVEAFCYGFGRDIDSGRTARFAKQPVVDYSNVLKYRSFAAASAHEGFVDKVMNPRLFNMPAIINQPQDILMRPDMVIAQRDARNKNKNK